MKLFKKVKYPNGRRHIYLFGVKIFSYQKQTDKNFIHLEQKINNTNPNLSNLWHVQRVKKLHSETFKKFKNINSEKDIVIVCTGPSLNNFIPIKDAIYIGVNKAFAFDKINLDYLFMQDYVGSKKYIEDSFPYKNKNLIRFYGIEPVYKIPYFTIPESVSLRHNALRYYCHSSFSDTPELPDIFAYDLCSEELYAKGSTVFPAIQFALYTNPKRIFLVGCDCSASGHFDTKDNTSDLSNLISHWKKLKQFIQEYYPETEIISVNPVGLKGLFIDYFQKRNINYEK